MSAQRMVDESSETIDLGNESMLDQSMSNSVLDVSQSAAIRSSRRRLKKGSAVVLNTDRLQKYIQQDKDEEDSVPPVRAVILGYKDRYNERMSHVSARESEHEVRRRETAASRVQRWWLRQVSLRANRYTLGGAWTRNASNRAFGMILGHRVRRLLRSPRVRQNIGAQQDVERILSDMCSSSKGRASEPVTAAQVEGFRRAVDSYTVDDLLLKYPGISHTDLTLAKSMCKQLLTERHKLSQLVLGGSRWRQFPAPGYWDLSAAVRREHAVAQEKEARLHNNIASPARKLPSHKSNMETPPSVRKAVRDSGSKVKPVPGELRLRQQQQNSRVLPEGEEYFEPGTGAGTGAGTGTARAAGSRRTGHSSSEEAGMRLRHSGERSVREIPAQLLRTPETQREFERDAVPISPLLGGLQSITGGHRQLDAQPAPVNSSSSNISSSSGSAYSPQAKRQRMSSRGHIQLNVLSAEKLMPARKGAPLRDANGGIVADRIPCVKVKLLLPNWTSGAGSRNQASPEAGNSSNLKKVFEQARDFTTVTLNPQWDTLFTLNLPCPRSVVHSIATTEAARWYDPHQQLSDRAYEAICRALLQWWSLGTVNIEIYDGERFNQDICMGFIDLLLSGFMVLIKKVDDLEIKGSFQLNKVKPSDRVSGTVKLHAFLHVPEKAYIADLLDPSSRVASSQAHPDRPLASHMDGNVTSDLDEAESEPRAESWPSSSAHSPPDAPVRPPVVYSSKFMQSLARHSQHCQASPTSDLDPPAAPVTSPESRPATAVNATSSTAGARAPLADPHMEESVNIRFTAPAGEMPSQQNISESARLLKEKLRKSKTARKPIGRAGASSEVVSAIVEEEPRRRSAVKDSEESAVLEQETLQASPQKQHSRSVPGSRIPVFAGAASRAQKEQSIDRGSFRRKSMEDINERLAGLTAVQHSSDAVLDNLNFKLGEKLRSRNETSVNDSQQDISADLNESQVEAPRAAPRKHAMDEVRRRMARAELVEPEEDAVEGTGDAEVVFHGLQEVPLMMPSTASLRRALHSSYSSREEDEDAPEMGGLSEDERSGDVSSGTEEFQDTYEDSGDESAPSPPPTRGSHDDRARDLGNGDEAEEYWDYQSESGNEASEEEVEREVPVWNAKRTDVDLSARRASPERGSRSYAEESPRREDARFGDGSEDEVDEFAEGDHSMRADLSTMSSVYSTSIMDFLSPEAPRSGRGGVGQISSASAKRRVEEEDESEDSGDELIVVGSSKEPIVDSRSESVRGNSSSRSPVKRFEVQSARVSSPAESHGSRRGLDARVTKASPSRSLFDASSESPLAPLSNGAGSPPYSPEAERKRSARSSPGQDAVHRVVLELDDLEL